MLYSQFEIEHLIEVVTSLSRCCSLEGKGKFSLPLVYSAGAFRSVVLRIKVCLQL